MEENKLGLPKDFFKTCKSKEHFHKFFPEMYKQGVSEMLKGEFDVHLGYDKHVPEGSGNSRDGFSSKKVKRETMGDVVLACIHAG